MSSTLTILKGQKILIIGRSSGIGRAVAAASLAHGASVVIASSKQPKVDAAVELLKKYIDGIAGVTISGWVVDVKNFKNLTEFLTKEAPFDHLIITAGELPPGFFEPLEDGVDLSQIDESINLRYWPFVNAARHIHKNKSIRPGGSIIGTIGTPERRPMPGYGYFAGALGAVVAATRGLAVDLKPLRVNTISPGIVDTDMTRVMSPAARMAMMEAFQKQLPVGRVGTPEEVAEAYIFAMKCQFLTGQIITVDGGGTLV